MPKVVSIYKLAKTKKKIFQVTNNFLELKYKYQLVVKINVNKYYRKLAYYLSFYINF